MQCNFDVAVNVLRSLVERFVAKEEPGLSGRERTFIVDFMLNDFVYYLGYRAGAFYAEEFELKKMREEVCGTIKDRFGWVKRALRSWYPWWRAKWLQRVKLVFSDEEFKRLTSQAPHQKLVDGLALDPKVNNAKAFTMYMLLRNGEYAGVEPIADFIVRSEIASLLNDYRENSERLREYLASPEFVERLARRVRLLRELGDYLLIIKVDLAQVL